MSVANTANRLSAAGHTITVLATDCGYRGREVGDFVDTSPEVSVHIFPSKGCLNRRLYRSSSLEQWIAKHVEEFDLLDIQGCWSASGIAVARVFRSQNKPYVLTPHGTMTSYDWQKSALRRKLFFRLGFGKIWRFADAVRFLSKGEETSSYHPAKSYSIIIPNGIDLEVPSTEEQRRAARATLGIPAQASVLLFLGRVTHQKGAKEALEAFNVAGKTLPDLFLVLVGPPEGTYGEEMNTLIKNSPMRDRILAPGAVIGSAKSAFYRSADAFISLSHNEGMSLALLEALSYGLPVILTKASNLDQLSEYQAGILTSHDPHEAATAVLKVMQDIEFRKHASNEARRIAAQFFSWETVIPQLVSLYQKVIDSRNDS